MQAMDSSNVALVLLNLSSEGFEYYRADTNLVLGVNIDNLAKIMRLANPTDSVVLTASDENPSHLNLLFESPDT